MTRPLLWSVRRELWENRSIYVLPLTIAGLLMFGLAMSTIGMAQRRIPTMLLDEPHRRAVIEGPYDMTAGMIIFTACLVAAFYCLDALHSERRDRTILFWKSLPVSDQTTVLSKVAIPLVVLPLICLPIILLTQLYFLMLSSVVLVGGHSAGPAVAAQWQYFPTPIALVYGLIVITLWLAPVYAWFLLVGGWARRVTFIWAVLPFFAVMLVEKIAFNTQHFANFVGYRIAGWLNEAFVVAPKGAGVGDPLSRLRPGNFLSTPGLWFGLLFAVAFVVAAIRLRRYREPI